MTTVNIREAAANFSKLLAAVEEKGETVLICRDGKPVAEWKSAADPAKVDRLKPNPDLKPIAINYDPTEPLPKDEWPPEDRRGSVLKLGICRSANLIVGCACPHPITTGHVSLS
jgi:antitoxin (DNA-binding transcriptional repressor) of toxin-antitoxin stability system